MNGADSIHTVRITRPNGNLIIWQRHAARACGSTTQALVVTLTKLRYRIVGDFIAAVHVENGSGKEPE